jgi:hypothetical protein
MVQGKMSFIMNYHGGGMRTVCDIPFLKYRRHIGAKNDRLLGSILDELSSLVAEV